MAAKTWAARSKKGWTDDDAVIATPDMMKSVGRLGKFWPARIDAEPETGTVTFGLPRQ